MFQLILNPIRDWNNKLYAKSLTWVSFQLILNPIRDWNFQDLEIKYNGNCSN